MNKEKCATLILGIDVFWVLACGRVNNLICICCSWCHTWLCGRSVSLGFTHTIIIWKPSAQWQVNASPCSLPWRTSIDTIFQISLDAKANFWNKDPYTITATADQTNHSFLLLAGYSVERTGFREVSQVSWGRLLPIRRKHGGLWVYHVQAEKTHLLRALRRNTNASRRRFQEHRPRFHTEVSTSDMPIVTSKPFVFFATNISLLSLME